MLHQDTLQHNKEAYKKYKFNQFLFQNISSAKFVGKEKGDTPWLDNKEVPTDFEKQLTHSKRKHDMIGIQVFDPIDATLPDVGLIEILDVESGQKRWIDTSNAQTRYDYHKQFISNTNLFKNAFLKAGADTISISTKEDYIKPLIKFFKNRV